jgi:opine dehydrogenase
MKVAVIGHSDLDIAPAVAADLALQGHDVAWWPAPEAVRAAGGVEVRSGAALERADGHARLRTPPGAAEALQGAAAVITDIPAARLLPEVALLADGIPAGALVHAQSHGYWPASRLAGAFDGRGWLLADSSGPTHAAALRGSVLQVHARRRNLRFSSIGGDALGSLRALYGSIGAADSPLETGLESLNLMVHPGATIANLAALDRAAAADGRFGFYAEGNTASAARLAEALDGERGAVCRAWGVRHRSLRDTLAAVYGASGRTLQQAIAGCPFYAFLGALPAAAPRRWAETDLPFALVPLIRLADERGVPVPLHRAAVAVLAAAFELDPWAQAHTLPDLGVLP